MPRSMGSGAVAKSINTTPNLPLSTMISVPVIGPPGSPMALAKSRKVPTAARRAMRSASSGRDHASKSAGVGIRLTEHSAPSCRSAHSILASTGHSSSHVVSRSNSARSAAVSTFGASGFRFPVRFPLPLRSAAGVFAGSESMDVGRGGGVAGGGSGGTESPCRDGAGNPSPTSKLISTVGSGRYGRTARSRVVIWSRM